MTHWQKTTFPNWNDSSKPLKQLVSNTRAKTRLSSVPLDKVSKHITQNTNSPPLPGGVKASIVTVNQTYPPASRRCALPDGGCSYRRHSGNTRGGRSSPRRSVSPSRTPAWCRSGRCRCRRAREGSPYAPHTDRKKTRTSWYTCCVLHSRYVFLRVVYYFREMPAKKYTKQISDMTQRWDGKLLKAVAPIIEDVGITAIKSVRNDKKLYFLRAVHSMNRCNVRRSAVAKLNYCKNNRPAAVP